MKDEFINKKIDAAMHSLDGIEKASPRPFLFTRLEARMLNDKSIWAQLSAFVTRPVIAFACICFVLIINLVVIFTTNNSENSLTQQGNELATTDEYSQVSSNLYEFENPKP